MGLAGDQGPADGLEAPLAAQCAELPDHLQRDMDGMAGGETRPAQVFRDLFQAMVMVDVDHLCLAVPNVYRYRSSGKTVASKYYEKTVSVADALYSHGRVTMPYGLTVVGY